MELCRSGAVQVRLRAGHHARGEGGRVGAVLGVEDEVLVHEPRRVLTRHLAVEHVEEVRRVREVVVGLYGITALADGMVRHHDARHLCGESHALAQRGVVGLVRRLRVDRREGRHDLTRPRTEAAREDLAVVGENRLGDAVTLHRPEERVADRSGGRALDDLGTDAVPRVIIDAGHDRQSRAIAQPYPVGDVHLPQLHRPGALPALVVAGASAPSLRLNQLVTDERAVDAGARRQRGYLGSGETTEDRARPPSGVLTAHLHHARFDHRRHLMRAVVRARTPVGQPWQSLSRVAAQPPVHRLSTDTIPTGHVGAGRSPIQHLEHRLILLFHEPQLHQHADLPRYGRNRPRRARRGHQERCRGVVYLPEPVSPRYRSRIREVSCRYRRQGVA